MDVPLGMTETAHTQYALTWSPVFVGPSSPAPAGVQDDQQTKFSPSEPLPPNAIAKPIEWPETHSTVPEAQLLASPNPMPDGMPVLLQGSYRAPLAAYVAIAPYSSGPIVSKIQGVLQIAAPTAIVPLFDYASGQPFNGNAYDLHPGPPKFMAPHTGGSRDVELQPKWLLAGTYRSEPHPSIDLLG